MSIATRAIFTGATGGLYSVQSLGALGFWNDVAEPRAVYHDGKTYLAWVRDDGHVLVATFDHTAGTLSTPTDLVTTTATYGVTHNAPAVLVRASDERIIVAVCESVEGGTKPVTFYVSTNPKDTSAFGSAQTIANVNQPTYPAIYQQNDGDIYYWIRYFNGSSTRYNGYYKSTDGGATWGSFQSCISPASTGITYRRIASNGSRLDIFTTDTDRATTPSAVYHMYLDDDDNLRKSDGTLIGAASSGPYSAASGTLIKNNSEGAARADGWGYDPATGYPAVLILVNSGGTTTLARVGRWNGSSWSVEAVVDAGGIIATNPYISSGAMAKDDPDTIYVPTKVGSYFELYRYRKNPAGGAWVGDALTSGSTADHAMPDTPLGAAASFRCVAGSGVFTDDTDFDFTMERYGF